MEGMIKEGFEEYPDNLKGTDHILSPIGHEHSPLRVGFRGGLRQPMDVCRHNGCLPRARVISLHKEMNISKAWHPFSEPGLRDKVH